ncbi:MAG TPA: hypothetical protein VN519_06320, partial [Bryobacteraceae bacterium]|nr:hypothetical protein [Bryobacteraceae bacterium]
TVAARTHPIRRPILQPRNNAAISRQAPLRATSTLPIFSRNGLGLLKSLRLLGKLSFQPVGLSLTVHALTAVRAVEDVSRTAAVL